MAVQTEDRDLRGRRVIAADVQAALAAGEAVLLALHDRCGALFTALAEGKVEHSRRPNISLALVDAGPPLLRVALRPFWHKRGGVKVMDAGETTAEVLVSRLRWVSAATGEPAEAVAEHKELAAALSHAPRRGRRQAHATRWSLWYGVAAAGRLVRLAGDFLANPAAVAARSADRCSICRRRLTDEVSRSRGVGPECLEYWGAIFPA
jgi:hypothetical protein